VARLDGECILLITVENPRGLTQMHLARSRDGHHFTVEREPFMARATSGPLATYENRGVRDPRITRLGEAFYISYIADSDLGLRLGLARTSDFASVERLGLYTQPDTKAGALFPEKIGGRFAALERPDQGMSIWVSYSDDLTYWGASEVVMTPRGGYWDAHRIGAAVPPIRIDQGWLLIYYGEKSTSAGPLVRLGAAILDAEDPARVVARSNIPILSPRERYERIGDVTNVVFSCGAVLADGELRIYYGASDSCICLAAAALSDIVETCLQSEKEF
jgi:predicted GH43/DUF377 family glycosyl hydrolase